MFYMEQAISTFVSALALFVSGLTAWLTLIRKGSVRITQPSYIAFTYDLVGPSGDVLLPKAFVRGMLYSTSMRSCIIENMYLIMKFRSDIRTLSVWGHGETNLLKRGSGLSVPSTGVVENHHFNPPENESSFRFAAGEYELHLFAEIVGRSRPTQLCKVELSVPEGVVEGQTDREFAIWFDRIPNEAKYHAYNPNQPPTLHDTVAESVGF